MIALAVCVALASPQALAQPAPAGPDEVVLKNGGFVRGTVVEVLPDTHVVIVPDGASDRRTIPWADVDKVERGKHAAPVDRSAQWDEPPAIPRAPPAAAIPQPPPAESPGPGRPRIHLELTRARDVTLHTVQSEIIASGYNASLRGFSWTNVCAAPCDRVVDGTRGQAFFFTTGDSIYTASRRFKTNAWNGDATIVVRPGNGPMRIVGIVLATAGAGFVFAGALFTALDSTRTIGIGMLAGGAPALVVGIPLAVLGRTRYEKR